MASNPLASVVIATRNRKSDVLRALDSCFRQDYANLEVLVFDDASADGTCQAIGEHFPQVRLFRESTSRGYVVLRNRGFREARGKYIFSLDDDAFYSHPSSINSVVGLLEQSSDVAAVAMPFVEPGQNPELTCKADAWTDVRSYVGCAHALRTQIALELGGYRELFVHQGEERDLCLRMLQRGYRIAQIQIHPIVHRISPVRDRMRMEKYAIRNTLLFDLLNVPQPYVLPRLAADAVRLALWMPDWPMTFYRAGFVLRGLVSCLKYLPQRSAVSLRCYLRYRSLPPHGPRAQGEIDPVASLNFASCSSSH